MEIPNTRRILVLGPPDAGLLDLIKDLTGSSPAPTNSSLAGLSHSWSISNAYYKATVPLWIDEIPPLSPSTWSADFLLPEAKEVLAAIGAFVVGFKKPIDEAEFGAVKGMLREVSRVVKDGCGSSWDGVIVAVALHQDVVPNLAVATEEWEDWCQDLGIGFEFIDGEAKGKNEFGEVMGIPRLKEALQANDWAGDDDEELDLDGIDDDGEGSTGFSAEAAEIESEMLGMKRAIYGGSNDTEEDDRGEVDEDEEDGVEKLEAMMLRMQTVKDMGSDLPEADRKKFAAKAVRDIMKTF